MIRALVCAALLGGCTVTEEACDSRSEVMQYLASRFREVPVAMGLSNKGHVVELLIGPGGSWTLLQTDTEGRACLTDAGDHFQTRRR